MDSSPFIYNIKMTLQFTSYFEALFPPEVVSLPCFVERTHHIHHIPGIFQFLTYSFTWNPFHFFWKSLSGYPLFELCLFILLFVFVGISNCLLLPYLSHFCPCIPTLSVCQFHIPVFSETLLMEPTILRPILDGCSLGCCTAAIPDLPSPFSWVYPLSPPP